MASIESIFFSTQNVNMLYTLLCESIESRTNLSIQSEENTQIIQSTLYEIMQQVFSTKEELYSPSEPSNVFVMKLNKKVLDISTRTIPILFQESLPVSFREQSSLSARDKNVNQQFNMLQQSRQLHTSQDQLRTEATKQFETQTNEINYQNGLSTSVGYQAANETDTSTLSYLHNSSSNMQSFTDILSEYNTEEKGHTENEESFKKLLETKLQERTTQFHNAKQSSQLSTNTVQPILPYTNTGTSDTNVPSTSNEHQEPGFTSSITDDPKSVESLPYTPFPSVQAPKKIVRKTVTALIYAKNTQTPSNETDLVNDTINPSTFAVQCMDAFLTQPKHIREIQIKSVNICSQNTVMPPFISISVPEISPKTMSTDNTLRESLCILHYDKKIDSFNNSQSFLYVNKVDAKQSFVKNELVSLPNTLNITLNGVDQTGHTGEWTTLFDNTTKTNASTLITLSIATDAPEQN